MMTFAAARQNMVDSQVRPNGITDLRLIAAMGQVPRENFVPAERRAFAYADEDVALCREGATTRFLTEPMTTARQLQVAAIAETDKVLIVGSATGYSCAVVALLAAQVVGLESNADLQAMAKAALAGCSNVTLVSGDLTKGHGAAAPYNLILIDGQVQQVPPAIMAQLAVGGRLVTVMGTGENGRIVEYTNQDNHVSPRSRFDATTAQLPGFAIPAPVFVF
jgi:protein-L-isoaspartate(D-aspartate) O-methyltransferase